MTAHSLIIAVSVGVAVGIVGRVLILRGRSVPLWLPVAVGVAAAVLATVVARMADSERPDLTTLEIVLQVLSAVSGIALVAITTDPAPGRCDDTAPGRPRATSSPTSTDRTRQTWPKPATRKSS